MKRRVRAILTYHAIDTSGSPISVSPAAFRRHVEYFVSARIEVVSIDTLLSTAGDRDMVALTFDDGFASVEREAAPLLAAHGLPWTLFVVTGCVGDTSRWSRDDGYGLPEQPLLGWDAIERLAGTGVTIASHTRTHPNLTRLSAAQRDEEIGGAAEDLERRLGIIRGAFAYPYGAVNPAVAAAVMGVHDCACGTALRLIDGEASPNLAELPRLDMWYFEAPGRLEQWHTPAFARWVRRRHRLRQVRALLRRVRGPR